MAARRAAPARAVFNGAAMNTPPRSAAPPRAPLLRRLPFRESVIVAIVLISGLLITAGVYTAARSSLEADARTTFERHVGRLEGEIQQRIVLTLYGLRGARAAVESRGPFSATQFRVFVDARNLDAEFPGTQGFGFVERVRRDAVRTTGDATDLYVVKYIEPQERNRDALGHDLGSDAAARQAAEAAIASGEPRLSAPVDLMHREDPARGWLLFVPVYQRTVGAPAAQQGPRPLLGLLYAPMVAAEALAQATSIVDGKLAFRLYDRTGDEQHLIFDSAHLPRPAGAEAIPSDANAGLAAQRSFDVVGRTLLLEAHADADALKGAGRWLPGLLALGGGLLSAVLALAAWLLLTSRGRAERIVQEMSGELHRARADAERSIAAKREFLANMSHELRTPMNGVLGMLLLLRSTQPSKRQLDYIGKTERAARGLLELLNQLLDFSKIEAGKMVLDPRPFMLDELLGDLASVLAANLDSKPIEIIFDVDPRVPQHLIGDDFRLRQVLTNLTGNALKFTHAGEIRIIIRSEMIRTGEVLLKFAVRDSGIGISPEQLRTIFRSFSQAEASTSRRFGGTGLGLTISRDLVRLLGGDLKVMSQPGVGSIFTFNLPLGTSTAEETQFGSGESVLFIDPHPGSRAALLKHARALGWRAADRPSLADVKAEDGAFETVFLNWQGERVELPAALAGCRKVGMVAGSAAQSVGSSEAMRRAGLDAVVIKPVTASMLQQAFSRSVSDFIPLGPSGADRPLKNLILLLAEDNLTNQQIAKELLTANGAEVQIVSDGREAVDLLRQQPAFDAVLMDVQMPVMDGYEATRIIRQELALDLPVIAITANARKEDRAACLAAGMNDHVGKPFDLEELIATVLRHAKRASRQEIVFDAQDLDRRYSANLEFKNMAITTFRKFSPALMESLAQAVAKENTPEVNRLAHSLKSNAGMISAPALAYSAMALESAAEQASTGQYAALFHQLQQDYQRCTEKLGDL